MGKGDKRTAKGKRVLGSYGKSRPKPSNLRDDKKKEREEAAKGEKAEKANA